VAGEVDPASSPENRPGGVHDPARGQGQRRQHETPTNYPIPTTEPEGAEATEGEDQKVTEARRRVGKEIPRRWWAETKPTREVGG
jgi:hypothetical protein